MLVLIQLVQQFYYMPPHFLTNPSIVSGNNNAKSKATIKAPMKNRMSIFNHFRNIFLFIFHISLITIVYYFKNSYFVWRPETDSRAIITIKFSQK